MSDNICKSNVLDELPGELRAAVERIKQRPVPQTAMHAALERVARIRDADRGQHDRLRLKAALGFAAAAVACIALGLVFLRPANLWAEVVKAVQSKPWIHVTLPGGEPGQSLEFWISTSRAAGGSRNPEEISFFDERLGIRYQYNLEKKVLYRLLISNEELAEGREFLETFQALFRGDAELKSGFRGLVLKDQKRSQTEKDGRKWDEYELHFQVPSSPNAEMTTTFLVDAQTRLPKTMTMKDSAGHARELTFDYPEKGPADIYALGVPKDAKVIDRVPTGDMSRILASIRTGRERFDDFQAIVVRSSSRESLGGPGEEIPMMFLVWKKGNRWRVETGLPVPLTEKHFAANKGMKERAREASKKTFFEPLNVCDGKVVYEASLGENRGSFRSVGTADQGPWLFSGPLKAMPFNWCYPDSFPPPNDRTEETVDLKPTEGPPNTIMVTSHLLHARDREIPYQRFWLDPARGYAVVRCDILNADAANKLPTTLVSQELMELWEQAPSGIWYPTRAGEGSLWKDRKPDARGVMPFVEWYHFFLDFRADMPEELFKPKKRTILKDQFPTSS
jgi:hypothetical protein